MTLTDKQKNRLRRLKLIADEGEIGLVKEINAIEDRIDDALVEKADRGDLESVRESVLAEVEKMMEENEPEEPEIIEGPPGPKGDDYVLTEKDKEDIAKSIKVPVVEKVVEKTETIREIPIVTENVVEVAVKDTPQETRNKLASLEGEERLNKSAIKGIDELEKYLSERIAQIRGGISGVARGIQLYISGVKKGLANTLNLKAGTNVTITHSYANGQNDVTISATGGSGSGVVESVVAGTGISVNSTDPANPVVSSTVTQYTDEMAQDAVGNAVGNGLDYDDTTGAIAVDETELTHNSIGGKQGGTTNEYYHLTSAQHTALPSIAHATVSGVCNGSNVTFTLSANPAHGVLILVLNGQAQTPTTEYSVSGTTITYVTAPAEDLDGLPHYAVLY